MTQEGGFSYKAGIPIDPLVPKTVRQVSPVAGMVGFSPVAASQELGDAGVL